MKISIKYDKYLHSQIRKMAQEQRRNAQFVIKQGLKNMYYKMQNEDFELYHIDTKDAVDYWYIRLQPEDKSTLDIEQELVKKTGYNRYDLRSTAIYLFVESQKEELK